MPQFDEKRAAQVFKCCQQALNQVDSDIRMIQNNHERFDGRSYIEVTEALWTRKLEVLRLMLCLAVKHPQEPQPTQWDRLLEEEHDEETSGV